MIQFTCIRHFPLLFIVCLAVLLTASAQVAAEIERPALKLAREYQDSIDPRDYLVSEKYDGVRAYWDGERLLSRQGNRIDAPQWFTQDFGHIPMDGELWMGRGKFEVLSGIVNSEHPAAERWEAIRFMVFDLPQEPGNFSRRYKKLKNLLDTHHSPYLVLVEQRNAGSKSELTAMLEAVVAAGGEGLMLQRQDAPYRGKRTNDLIKLKPWNDAEAKVIGHTPGKGKYDGMLGALIVETENGIRFKIGTGFSDRQRRYPPPIGSIITYKYSGTSRRGVPRFASFLRMWVRH